MVRRALQLIFLLLLGSSACFAGGSTFGANGLGEELIQGGTRARGLGGGGLGLQDTISFNTKNPALLAFARSTIYRMSGHFAIWSVQGATLSDTDSEISWSDLHMFLPVTNRLNIGLGVEPARRSQLKTFAYRNATFDYEGVDSTLNYEERIVWSGGTTDLALECGYRLHDRFSLGVTFGYSFTTFNRDVTIDFEPSEYRDAIFYETARMKGWWTRLGVYWQPLHGLGIGGYFRPASGGDWELERSENDGSEAVLTSRDGETPAQFGCGIAYSFDPQWVVTADAEGAQWNRRDLGILYDNNPEIAVENPLFLSFGLEKLGVNEYIGGNILDWPWRVGFFQRAHYWTDVNGDQVIDMGATFGTSVPIANWLGRLHLAGEYGKRDGAAVSEDFFRMSVQVEMSEKWFQRDKPRIPK